MRHLLRNTEKNIKNLSAFVSFLVEIRTGSLSNPNHIDTVWLNHSALCEKVQFPHHLHSQTWNMHRNCVWTYTARDGKVKIRHTLQYVTKPTWKQSFVVQKFVPLSDIYFHAHLTRQNTHTHTHMITFILSLFNDASNSSVFLLQMTGRSVNNKFKNMWNKAVVAYFKTGPQFRHLSGGTDKRPSKQLVSGTRAEVGTSRTRTANSRS